MPYVDCHLHLQDASFSRDLDAVWARAQAAGVRRLICNGTCEADWPAVRELARTREGVFPCFGLHPWYVRDRSGHWLETLREMLTAGRSAVGEIGLDRHAAGWDDGTQQQVFREQLRLACELGRPAMVHCVGAWGELAEALRADAPPAGVVLHAYGGPAEMVGELAAGGAYFSFAGTVLAGGRDKARRALVAVPADRLLTETDSPDLIPPPAFRACSGTRDDGRPRNEPANLPEIVRGVAALRGLDAAALADRVWHNVCRLVPERKGGTS